LHSGHISLIKQAQNVCDFVVCSIFVNPSQFNNANDLKVYHRTVEADQKLLEEANCDLLFLPSFEVIYPNGIPAYSIDLQGLDQGMEGAFRPGHFNGVCMVVERFFELISPNKAFFGLKDFQQLAIIRKMTKIRNLPIEIIASPIARAKNGLALSSRNALLTEEQRTDAGLISKALKAGIQKSKEIKEANAVKKYITTFFEGQTEMVVEYVEIVENENLTRVAEINDNCTVCIVVFYGNVRLIDNMQFSESSN
ncbi:MAG: pantoate--beta-alanine ligase, partial [Crocinitomix sp.]|nr:pantoate--beta-alanine ligase [Crocinitomix sp.]